MNDKEYQEKFQAFKAGLISQKDWQDYCKNRLDRVLLENIDVFKRLKDR